MREVFKGWRRKVGVVTLVMALILMAAWLRSFAIRDTLRIPTQESSHYFRSVTGSLQWRRFDSTANGIAWRSYTPAERESAPRWEKWDWSDWMFEDYAWIIPYWSIVIPLTLLSAYLLLWKPRKRTGPGHA